jgi:hypothetical protein
MASAPTDLASSRISRVNYPYKFQGLRAAVRLNEHSFTLPLLEKAPLVNQIFRNKIMHWLTNLGLVNQRPRRMQRRGHARPTAPLI